MQKIGATFSELLEPDSVFHYYAQLPAWGLSGMEGFNGQINALDKIVKAYTKAKAYDKALRFNQRILERMEQEEEAAKKRFVIYNNLGYNYNFQK